MKKFIKFMLNQNQKGSVQFFDIDETKTIYELKSGSYKKVDTLGEGAFGKVLLVQKISPDNEKALPEDSYYFALKISKRFQKVKKGKKSAKEDGKNLEEVPKEINFVEIRELSTLKNLSRSHHLNIVNMLDFKLEQTETWILMEYLKTDLMKFYSLNKDNPKVMNEKFFKNISFQILCGIDHLHSELIIHRDIKLENILYDEENNIAKIGDFGLCRNLDYCLESQYTDVGTYPYKPPEVLLGEKKYTTAFDIWSIGCLLVQICTMSLLFGANDPVGVLRFMYDIFGSFNDNVFPGYKKLPNANLIANLPEKAGIGLVEYIKQKQKFKFENEHFYDLITKMLCINYANRFTAKQCLSHAFFNEIDVI